MSNPQEAKASLRTEAGFALRELGHELTSHEVSGELLAEIAQLARALRERVAEGPPRSRGNIDGFLSAGSDDESRKGLFPDSIVSGSDNPMGINAKMSRDGDDAVLIATLRSAHQGAPGRAHGGIVAALFDEAMGLVLSMINTVAFTGWLKVSYRAPTPLHEPLEVRARMLSKDGRKISMEAEMTSSDGTLIAEATSLFIEVDLEAFLGTRSHS